MTPVPVAHLARGLDEEIAAGLWAAIQPEFMTLVGWEHNVQVMAFPQNHPSLGWNACVVQECGKITRASNQQLCRTCTLRWRRTGGLPLDEFIAISKTRRRAVPQAECAVPACCRPRKTVCGGLCDAHHYRRRKSNVTLAKFLALPDLVGMPSFGPCLVEACIRDRSGKAPYCATHSIHWRKEVRRDPKLDENVWRRTSPAVAQDNLVSLRGLPPRVVAELLYGLQQRTHFGTNTKHQDLRPFVDRVRRAQVGSLDELDPKSLPRRDRAFTSTMVNHAYLLRATPEAERHKDVWNAVVFGHSRMLRFTGISQPWLREAAKRWAFDDLPRRRGAGVNMVQARLRALSRLSESLCLQREDHGASPALLGRADITAFTNRLAFLAGQGKISLRSRVAEVRDVRNVLTRMRNIGLSRTGEPLHGLPDDFSVRDEDIPDVPEDTEAGRDLPGEVMRQLCDHLPLTETTSRRELRIAVELLIDTGRRPSEIATLSWDCLEHDGDGKPVLIYDNHKAARHGRRLPIGETTAALIMGQQERVRARFPDTPTADLKLLPAPHSNPHGRKALAENWISERHRAWVNELPPILVPTDVEENGARVTKMLPFDKATIFPYAYRHCYAQRHADAGVDVTVLKELLNHRQLSTTQAYYRVGEERRREAVERVTVMQFDRHGNRVWRRAKAMLDSEHARRAIGEVAVPYGGCSKPSNVAAGGEDCPFRFRCIGCGHFSTDISYLPDLERYLADLLRHRERLAATLDADEWAKSEAMPSDNEINIAAELLRLRRKVHLRPANPREGTSPGEPSPWRRSFPPTRSKPGEPTRGGRATGSRRNRPPTPRWSSLRHRPATMHTWRNPNS